MSHGRIQRYPHANVILSCAHYQNRRIISYLLLVVTQKLFRVWKNLFQCGSRMAADECITVSVDGRFGDSGYYRVQLLGPSRDIRVSNQQYPFGGGCIVVSTSRHFGDLDLVDLQLTLFQETCDGPSVRETHTGIFKRKIFDSFDPYYIPFFSSELPCMRARLFSTSQRVMHVILIHWTRTAAVVLCSLLLFGCRIFEFSHKTNADADTSCMMGSNYLLLLPLLPLLHSQDNTTLTKILYTGR
jgi:hypothetical protein